MSGAPPPLLSEVSGRLTPAQSLSVSPQPRHQPAASVSSPAPASSPPAASNTYEDVGQDWARVLDPNSGKYYYAHRKTLATSWTMPAELIPPPPPPPSSEVAAFVAPPVDYERILDPASNRFYYVHLPTRSVSWNTPEAFKAFEEHEKKQKEAAAQASGSPAASPAPRRTMPPPLPVSVVSTPPPLPHQRQGSLVLGTPSEISPADSPRSSESPRTPDSSASQAAAALHLGGGTVPRDSRGLPILPAGLKSAITKFQLSGYASEHFRVFKKKVGILSSRPMSVAELLCWQKLGIEKSLTSSAKKVSSLAVNAFGMIQCFMGDIPTKKTQSSIAKELIQLAVTKPILRDELYSQLCKQTKNNPDFRSTCQGWRLLSLFVCHFPPSRGFQDYLLKYFLDHFINREEILLLAPWCYYRILKTIKHGPTENISLSQIESFVKQNQIPSHFIVFDLSLEYSIQLQKAEGFQENQPILLIRLCEAIKRLGGFQMKGIFRIAAQKDHVQSLRNQLEQGNYEALQSCDAHTAADILKIWLRDLYETIFPASLYEQCLNASDSITAAMAICKEIPIAHYATLDYLMDFLVALTAQQSINAMNEENLAIVFSQDLLRNPEGSTASLLSDPSSALMKSNKEKNFVKTLLEIWKSGKKPL